MPNEQKEKYFYGTDSQQFAHLYMPNVSKDVPVVIVIHGGYWKDNHNLDSYATSAIVDYLQTLNVAIWNLEYRRMNALGENTKAPWPACFNDIADGIDHLKTIVDSKSIDLKRVLLIGHSAGGLLATWAASRKTISSESELYRESPLPVQRVISIAGILNLFAANDVDQPEQIERLMGGTPDTHLGRYQVCDPCALYTSDLNLTVVHGEKDTCVNVEQAKKYCQQSNGDVNKIIMADADHFSMLPHDGVWHEEQWRQIKKLVALEISVLN